MKAHQYPSYCKAISFTPDLHADAYFRLFPQPRHQLLLEEPALARPFRCCERHSLWEIQTRM